MDISSFDYSTAIVAHATYFGIAIVATVLFVAIYVTVTPHREFALIRQSRLSVMAVTPEHWRRICQLGGVRG